MSHAHPIGRLLPHTPIPVETRYVSIAPSSKVMAPVIESVTQYLSGVLKTSPSTIELI